MVINQTVANKLWPGEDPVGRMANAGGADAHVIGVVADVHESSAESAAGWQMYLPASQQGPEGANLVIRSKLPPETLAPAVMSTLRSINPGQPATEFKPIQGLVDHAVSPRRFFVMLVGVFAGLGLLLASLGIYGVISYSVTQRTQEIGIRMALGATQGRVQRGSHCENARVGGHRHCGGNTCLLSRSRLIASLLFGTAPTDPLTFMAIVFVLGVGGAAGWIYPGAEGVANRSDGRSCATTSDPGAGTAVTMSAFAGPRARYCSIEVSCVDGLGGGDPGIARTKACVDSSTFRRRQ